MLEKIIFSLTNILCVLVYFSYFYKIWKNKAFPHVISWGIWLSTCVLTFFGQIAENGGLGAYITLQQGFICLVVILLGLKNFHKEHITKKDIATLFLCFLGGLAWVITNDGYYTILINTGICVTAFIPTYAKNYRNPHSSPLYLYLFWCTNNTVALFLLEERNIETVIFPAALLITTTAMVLMILFKRYQLKFTAPKQVYSS